MDISYLTENEVEFLAEDEVVTITPSFVMKPVKCLACEYGPFRPNRPIDVPLWLAMDLKKKNRCKIHPPPWMSVEHLTAIRQQEQSTGAFSDLPYHYIEIATMLLAHAADDFQEVATVSQLLREIQALRSTKIREGLKTIGSDTQNIKLRHMSAMELNINRPFMMGALDAFFKLNPSAIAYKTRIERQQQQQLKQQQQQLRDGDGDGNEDGKYDNYGDGDGFDNNAPHFQQYRSSSSSSSSSASPASASSFAFQEPDQYSNHNQESFESDPYPNQQNRNDTSSSSASSSSSSSTGGRQLRRFA